MNRIKAIAEKMMTAIHQHPESHKRMKLKYSRKQYQFSFTHTNDTLEFWLTNPRGKYVRYDGKKKTIESTSAEFFWILGMFETMSVDEISEYLQMSEMKFSKKQIDVFQENEQPVRNKTKSYLRALKMMMEPYKTKQVAVKWKDTYLTFSYHGGKQLEWIIGDEKTGYRDYIEQTESIEFNHFLYEDVLEAMANMPERVIHTCLRNETILDVPHIRQRPTDTEKMVALLEKRNDLKLLHRMFGDEKYARNVQRIDNMLKKYTIKSS